MKKTAVISFSLIPALAVSTAFGFSFPNLFWPHNDLKPFTIGDTANATTVLIASRSSEFKDALIKKLAEKLNADSMNAKFIGIEALAKETDKNYWRIVIINTCMAWSMENKVSAFIKRSKNPSSIILLTTSGKGTWLPNKEGRNYDALCSASKIGEVDKLANQIFALIRK